MKSAGVGADSWRRTGILTFDRNWKVEKKATFSRIKEHLERVYQRKWCKFVLQERKDSCLPVG